MKLDFGCGPNPREGFEGVDRCEFGGKVKHVLDLTAFWSADNPLAPPAGQRIGAFIPWPWPSSSVDEAFSSHFVEHLTAPERVHFFNELHRILKPNATAQIIAPHWSSARAYGDPTHQWPPFSEMAFYYLRREWRMSQAPHTDVSNWPEGFSCDFEATWGYSFRNDPDFMARNDAYKQYAMTNYKDVVWDVVATITAKKTEAVT